MMLAALGWVAALGATTLALVAAVRLRMREELVVRACHELRSPLTAARLALHAVGAAQSTAGARALACLDLELRRAGLALDDLAAAREGRQTVARPAVVDAAELLEEVRAAWSPVADAFGVQLHVGEARAGLAVRGDRGRLVQALGNLVGNGLEHGGGRVDVALRESGGKVRLEVSDKGPGLPASVATLTGRARGGRGRRGRGLAIASDIARRHSGQLVAAPSSRGARLALELPALGRANDHHPGPGGPRLANRAPGLRRLVR